MKDHAFLGLQATHNPHRWYLPVVHELATRGDFLFGGCGLAAAISAMEQTCGRPTIWATAQYLSYARPPAVMDLDVIVPVEGKNTTQARVVAHVGDTEILTVNAALGSRPLEIGGQWAAWPDAPPPDQCTQVERPKRKDGLPSIDQMFDFRVVKGAWGGHGEPGKDSDGHSVVWLKARNGAEISAPLLAVMADWMPSGIAEALGRRAGGNSLDNTIRIIKPVPTEWVLCDIHIHGVNSGFGHGRIHLWSEDGTLMASGGQSLIIRMRD